MGQVSKYPVGQGCQTNRLGVEAGGEHAKIGKMMCITFLSLTEIILNTVEALVSRHPRDAKKV